MPPALAPAAAPAAGHVALAARRAQPEGRPPAVHTESSSAASAPLEASSCGPQPGSVRLSLSTTPWRAAATEGDAEGEAPGASEAVGVGVGVQVGVRVAESERLAEAVSEGEPESETEALSEGVVLGETEGEPESEGEGVGEGEPEEEEVGVPDGVCDGEEPGMSEGVGVCEGVRVSLGLPLALAVTETELVHERLAVPALPLGEAVSERVGETEAASAPNFALTPQAAAMAMFTSNTQPDASASDEMRRPAPGARVASQK